eukprot:6455405-Amphidinium_carterae.1
MHRTQPLVKWQYEGRGNHYLGYHGYYGYSVTCNGYHHVDILQQSNTKVKWTGAVLDSINLAQTIVDCLSSSTGCLLLSSIWSLLVMLMSSRQAFRTAMQRLCIKAAAFWQDLYGDLCTLLRAFAVMASEVLFVVSRRSCCYRRRLRQWGLRLRAYQPGPDDMDDDILLTTPRRTLSQIQQANGLAMGGSWWNSRRPRKMGKVRLPMPHRRRWRVHYNPRTSGECLFACVQRIGQLQGLGHKSTSQLRALSKTLLQRAKSGPIAGQRLETWLQGHRTTVDDFILNTTRGRWGTQLDAFVLAEHLGLRLRIIDVDDDEVILPSTCTVGRVNTIAFSNSHFFLIAPNKRLGITDNTIGAVLLQGGAKRGRQQETGGATSSHDTQPPEQRRRYPFAGMTTAERDAIQDEKMKELQVARKTRPVILIAHGSFNPAHIGHIQMMQKARSRLIREGYQVQIGVLAIANRTWIWGKNAPALADILRIEVINRSAAAHGCADWLRADANGIHHNSHWQMMPGYLEQHPGATIVGVWGSDYCAGAFPAGAGVCVYRRGFAGPREDPDSMQFSIEEDEDHSHSSTKLRKAILSNSREQIARIMGPSLVDFVLSWGVPVWHTRSILEVEKLQEEYDYYTESDVEVVNVVGAGDNVHVINDEYVARQHERNTPPVAPQPKQIAKHGQALHRPPVPSSVAMETAVLPPVPAKAMPKRRLPVNLVPAAAQHTHDEEDHIRVPNRPPLARRGRVAPVATPAQRPPLRRQQRQGPPTPYNLIIHRPIPQRDHVPEVIKFSARLPFDEACAFVGEPIATMLNRDVTRFSLSQDGTMRMYLADGHKQSALTSFPARAQVGALTIPLERAVAKLAWLSIDGNLREYDFRFLHFGHLRDILRHAIVNIMQTVRRRCLLSRPAIAMFSLEPDYHAVKLVTEPLQDVSRARAAEEIMGHFNSLMAAEQLENDLQGVRCFLMAAAAVEETESGDDTSDGMHTLVQGGGACKRPRSGTPTRHCSYHSAPGCPRHAAAGLASSMGEVTVHTNDNKPELAECALLGHGVVDSHDDAVFTEANDDSAFGETGNMLKQWAPGAVMFVPCKSSVDPLMECIAWIIRDTHFKHLSLPSLCSHLRTLSSIWLRTTFRSCMLVAGMSLGCIAALFDVDTENCADFISAASRPANGAHVLVYALSCLLPAKVCVVDESCAPVDGFLYVNATGVRFKDDSWEVVQLAFSSADLPVVALSSTLEFIELPLSQPFSECARVSLSEGATDGNAEEIASKTLIIGGARRNMDEGSSSGTSHSPGLEGLEEIMADGAQGIDPDHRVSVHILRSPAGQARYRFAPSDSYMGFIVH